MKKANRFIHTWAAIIAGGQGTRLFPLSHDTCPKQFCHLDDENTFIQATIRRFVDFGIKPNQIVIITTNDDQTKLAIEQTLPLGIISQNIYQIDPHFGYAGAMVKAAEFIYAIDKEAVIINTPSDQYIVSDDKFYQTLENAITCAESGSPTIIGVKINDLVTAMGCGHALYDATENNACRTVIGFVEKPDRDRATQLMRTDSSACNTGINIWSAHILLQAVTSKKIGKKGLSTDVLMQKLGQLKVAVGKFQWYDCGTLKSLYDISVKTPNHKNASLGQGRIDRVDCRRSLFYAIAGINLYVTGVEDTAVLATAIEDRIVIAIVKLADSQRVRNLAEDYQANKDFLTDDFSVGARNNIIVRTNISKEIRVGFVSVDNYIVYTHKNPNGTIEVAVSQQLIADQ